MTTELPTTCGAAVRSSDLLACSGKTVLSLFDYSGNWSLPYEEAGANVVQIDLKHGVDVMDLDCAWLSENVLKLFGTVDAILAAPPCTDFAGLGARWWKEKDASGSTAKSLELVRQVLRFVEYLKPDWWAMENPVGRLNRLLPELVPFGPWYFQPCDYGDPYTKKTGLWGNYVPPLPLFVGGDKSVQPVMHTLKGKRGSWMWAKLGGKSERTKTVRSTTPMGFSRAFFAANCWGATQQANEKAEP